MRSFATLLGCAALIGAETDIASCETPCRPWVKDAGCAVGNNLDLRFSAGDPDCSSSQRGRSSCGTNAYPKGACNGGTCAGYKSHFYCATVDHFSSFKLTGSNNYLTSSIDNIKIDNGTFSIFAYGTGKLGAPEIPVEGQSTRVPVFQKVHPDCDGNAAVGSFLVYNVTMSGGEYTYSNDEPIGTGFVNTCTRGRCQFEDDSEEGVVCIDGPNGASNCGKCVVPEKQPADIRVLVSFYGSDASGHAYLSGSSNPLNFRKFAVGDLPYDISKNIDF